MVEQTVAFREVHDVYMHRLHEFTGVFHTEIEPLQVSVAISVITHEAVESVVGSNADLIEVRTLKVGVEGQGGLCLVRVQWDDLPLGIRDGLGLSAAISTRTGIDRSLKVGSRCQCTLFIDSVASARVSPILRIRVRCCRRCAN